MTSANLTRDETAARSAVIRLQTVSVEVDLRDAPLADVTGFSTASTLVFEALTDSTWIDFIGEHVDEVIVNGTAQRVDWDGARVRITGLADANTVLVRGRARYSTSGEGMHRFRDPVDDETYLYTQYEPADCRRVYPCFEQPDLKARWTFAVAAPSGWRVLSNGAEVERDDVDGGVRVVFAETLPLSSYITAIAAGPYHRVEGTWEGPAGSVPLGVMCRASLAPHLDADEILDVTRRGLAFFSEAFALPYPWGIYDQIFVPEYNLGAMENPGLVTFTEAYLFRGASTSAQHEGRATTILHEMAHMWFGDLVTMRWWDDLWLKESFADFMGTYAAAVVGGHPDAWVSFASRRKAWAYAQDQLPTTHPIVADITDLEAAKLNFDGITYAKGAAVLRQLVAFVGEDEFFRGAQRYFADHAFGNTSLSDLLTALQAASGRDLSTWSDAWLRTSGVSVIGAVCDETGGLALEQTDPRPHRMAVGVFELAGDRAVRHDDIALDVIGEHIPIDVTPAPGGVFIVPNIDDSTYAKVRLDDAATDAVQRSLSTIHDPLARAVVWAALWNAARDGMSSVARYVAIVARHALLESNAVLLADAIAHAGFAIVHYAAPRDRAALAQGWLETCWRALWASAPGSDAQLSWARGVGFAAAYADDRSQELTAILAGDSPAPAGLRLDPDMRWGWLAALSARGHVTQSDADAELAVDPTAHGRTAHRRVLAARPDESVRVRAWHEAWDDASLTNDELDATIAGVRAGDDRRFVGDLDEAYFAAIRTTWSERSIEIARRLVVGLFPASESLAGVDAWLATNLDAPGALRRLIIEQRDARARALRVQVAQASLD